MKFEKMKIVNPKTAGIDVGSKSHFVALGQEKEDVFEFGLFTKDHKALIDFLHVHSIETIAMESSCSYCFSHYKKPVLKLYWFLVTRQKM